MNSNTSAQLIDTSAAYYWLKPRNQNEPRHNNADLHNSDLRAGIYLNPDLIAEPVRVKIDQQVESLDFSHFIGDSSPLVSDRFLATLNLACIDNYQAFPALLKGQKTGNQQRDYSFLNIIGLLDPVDWDASEGEILIGSEEKPEYVEFSKLILSAASVFNFDLFRLASNRSIILVHDRLRRAFSDNMPVDGWGIDWEEVEMV